MSAATGGATQAATPGASPGPARRDNAARFFGYDVFISFALGGPPRGSLSYASDLARRLRERDFTVFFSEDEAPPGEQLDSTLQKALHGSRALVVIANRGTLEQPRWVRTEVELFRSLRPPRPVIPISVGGALQDPELGAAVNEWLPFKDKIWLDETLQAAEHGLASPELVDRLALVPRRVRSNVKWRWLVRAVVAALLLLAVGLGVAAKVARDNEQRARAELMRSVSLRAAAEAPAMVAGVRAGGHERALQQLLAAYAIGSAAVEVQGAMLSTIVATDRELKLLDTGAVIRAVAFSPDAAQLVTGGAGGRVQRWDARTLQPIGAALQGPENEVFSVAYSPDGGRIAAGDLQGRLWLWNAQSGAALGGAAPGERGAIRGLAFTPDGQRIVSAGVGGTLQFWDARTAEALGEPIASFGEVIAALAVSPDGQRIVSGGDYHLQLWSAKGDRWSGVGLESAEEEPTWVYALAFSPDGTRIAAAGSTGLVQLWDARSGRRIDRLRLQTPSTVQSLHFGPDGKRLLVGGAAGMLTLWDIDDARATTNLLKNQDGAVTSADFAAGGLVAASGGEDGLLRLWDTHPTSAFGAPLAGPAPALASSDCKDARSAWPEAQRASGVLAWSADCALAVAGLRGALQLIDGRSGARLGKPVRGHQTREVRDANAKNPLIAVVSAAFSADGQHIVSGSQNGSIQRWQASPLAPVGEMMLGHAGTVTSVAYSPDGQAIASGGSDSRLRLWDAQSGLPLGPPLVQAQGVKRVAFSADDRQVLTQDDTGVTRLWPAPARWPETLCAKLVRGPSLQQWQQWLSPEIEFVAPCPGLATPAAPS